jgi:hypothetical protein
LAAIDLALATSHQNKQFKWEQVREALTDPVVWIIWTMQIAIFIPVSGAYESL